MGVRRGRPEVFKNPRFEESRKKLTEFLVKHHRDKDGNSLFVRFAELMREIDEMEFTINSLESVLEIVNESRKKNSNDSNIPSGKTESSPVQKTT